MRLALAALTTTLVLAPTAALADEAHATREEQLEQLPVVELEGHGQANMSDVLSARLVAREPLRRAEPLLAATLSLAPSAVLGAVALSTPALAWTGALMPLTVGLGQAYAGDPWRGLWVTLGSSAAIAGGGAVGGGLQLLAQPGASPWTGALYGGLAGYGLYTLWSGLDAYRAAGLHAPAATALRP